MGNVEIISIVFGFSALIMIMLIFVFRWLGIRSENCCFNKKENLYMIDILSKTKNDKNSLKTDSDFTKIWNSERSLSIITTDTILNEENGSTINMQLKPNLKPMIFCPTNNEDRLLNIELISHNNGLLEVELNSNP